jgi:hypothetical protein
MPHKHQGPNPDITKQEAPAYSEHEDYLGLPFPNATASQVKILLSPGTTPYSLIWIDPKESLNSGKATCLGLN